MARVRRDDQVMVIRGKDRGKKGKVLQVFPSEGRAIVEGINLVKKHLRKSQDNPQGAVITKEARVPLDRVMPLDPKSGKPVRVGYKFLQDGTKVRISKASGETF